MKKIILIFAGIISLLSCSKDENNSDSPNGRGCVVKSITGTGGDYDKINFEYDDEGRVIKIVDYLSDTKLIITTTTYTYGMDEIKVKSTSNNNDKERIDIYLFNDNRVFRSISDNGFVRTYEYDNNGYLSSIRWSSDDTNYDTNIAYKDGNISLVQSPGYGSYLATYNDSPRLPYTESLTGAFSEWLFFGIDDATLYEQGYFGKLTKNQIVSLTHDDSYKFSFTYKNDNKGKINSVSKILEYPKNAGYGNERESYDFNYDCD